jgi:hypothetical protein
LDSSPLQQVASQASAATRGKKTKSVAAHNPVIRHTVAISAATLEVIATQKYQAEGVFFFVSFKITKYKNNRAEIASACKREMTRCTEG